jgi:sulfotransferase
MEKIFFQSSLPRAGSTLLQNIFAQNPNFYVTPTSGILELVYAARANYTNSPEFKAQDTELMKKGFLNFCKGGVESFFNSITDKKYVLDKSRGWGIHYGFLNSFYHNPKIVCMIRDPRDIFASMEKNFRKAQHVDSGIVNHAAMSGTTTEKRIDIWSNSQPVGLALERLYQITREGLDEKILFIKFEELSANPEKEINKIYDYFEIERYLGHDFNNVEQTTSEDDSVYGIFGDHNIRAKIEPVKSSYREVLGIPSSNWIKTRYEWFYRRFNYH